MVSELVVKEEHRNRGIGRQLLDFAVEEAERRGMDEIELGVDKKIPKQSDSTRKTE